MKFLVNLGKGPTDCLKLLHEVYGEATMSCVHLFEWHKHFTSGHEDVEDDPKSGRLPQQKSADIGKVNELVWSNHRLTVHIMAEELNINYEFVHIILLEELHMHKVCTKIVPKLLSDDQKQHHIWVYKQIQISLAASSLETNLGCSNTTWKPRGSGRPQIHHDQKKVHMSKSKIKTMQITFFDQKSLMHHKFVPQDQTANQHFYQQVLNCLNDWVHCCRPALWKDKSWMLHHDNAPAHTALSMWQLLTNKRVAVLGHPPYSLDLAPCDFWLFPKLKSVVKGMHFASVGNIKDCMTRELRCLMKEDFANCFRVWQGWMIKCSNSGGEYFEGDK